MVVPRFVKEDVKCSAPQALPWPCARRWRTAMNIDHRNPRLRRGFAFVALAAVLGLSAVGLTQCRMVDDTVTGVNVRSSDAFTPGPHPQCIHACNNAYKACVRNVE